MIYIRFGISSLTEIKIASELKYIKKEEMKRVCRKRLSIKDDTVLMRKRK